MLEAKNLISGYGALPILHGLSLRVDDNEYVGILGHNGMGKTTLMRTLIGHIKPMSGSISLDGEPITDAGAHKRARMRIGYVPQGREIFPSLTVRENLMMGALSGAEKRGGIVEEVLADFPRLERLLDRNGGALSGGEQQLLAIARCLCGRPRVMLLDEPTEGIQPSIIKDIGRAISYLRSLGTMAIVLVEQYLDFACELGDNFAVMDRGAVKFTCDRSNLDPAEISRQMAL